MFRPRLLLLAPFALVGIALFCFLGGYIVMRLWNWLTPGLFGWHTLTFWQAFGILVLCRILFGRMGLGGRHGGRRWLTPRERFQRLGPEEKARFKKKILERWGILEPEGEGGPQSS